MGGSGGGVGPGVGGVGVTPPPSGLLQAASASDATAKDNSNFLFIISKELMQVIRIFLKIQIILE